jgi:hypothetical protein
VTDRLIKISFVRRRLTPKASRAPCEARDDWPTILPTPRITRSDRLKYRLK